MKLGTALIADEPRVVVEAGDGVALAPESVAMTDVIAGWSTWRARLEELAAGAAAELEPGELRWLPPVMPDKLICVGINYSDHVAEMEAVGGPKGHSNPWPFGFLKPPRTALVGHDARVALPGYAEKVDWEAELAVVIGDGSKATGAEPLDAVFGYSVLNDISVRDYMPFPHALGLDTVVCKGFDNSAPMGPWIVPASEIAEPQDLPLRLSVNGTVKQDSTTARMIFGVREIVRHYARVMTLSPGDVIATGTSAGVGIGRRPPEVLRDGDVVEVEIEGIGLLRTTFSAAPPAEMLRAS